jgi:hypothetical protein
LYIFLKTKKAYFVFYFTVLNNKRKCKLGSKLNSSRKRKSALFIFVIQPQFIKMNADFRILFAVLFSFYASHFFLINRVLFPLRDEFFLYSGCCNVSNDFTTILGLISVPVIFTPIIKKKRTRLRFKPPQSLRKEI